MKRIIQNGLGVGAGLGLFLASNVAVLGNSILYDNSTTDTGSSLNFVNGTTIGDQITLGGSAASDTLTAFSFEIYSPDASFSGSPQIQVFLYANDGSLFNGYASPGSTLYDSGPFSLVPPLVTTSGSSQASTIQFDLTGTPITVPQTFTLALKVTGLMTGNSAGVELFNPPTVGQNFGDYWQNTGSGWGLYTNTIPVAFGARFEGSSTPAAVPDVASTAALLGTSLSCLGMLLLLRRKAA